MTQTLEFREWTPLIAHEERDEAVEAVREPFNELEREIIKHKKRMRHDDEYEGPARREKRRGLR